MQKGKILVRVITWRHRYRTRVGVADEESLK